MSMKAKSDKKSSKQLRHAPLGNEMEKPVGKLRPPKVHKDSREDQDEMEEVPDDMEEKISKQAKDQRIEVNNGSSRVQYEERWPNTGAGSDSDEVRTWPLYIFLNRLTVFTSSFRAQILMKILITKTMMLERTKKIWLILMASTFLEPLDSPRLKRLWWISFYTQTDKKREPLQTLLWKNCKKRRTTHWRRRVPMT